MAEPSVGGPRFDDRVAVVTGAGRGLGRAYALLLAAKGAKVVVNDTGGAMDGEGVDTTPAEEVAKEIQAAGGEAVACAESVATAEGGKAIVASALEHFGRIDVLVHNAGNHRPAPLAEMTYEDFDAVVDVHLRGAWNVVRPAFPLMSDQGYGRIVLTSSIGGLYGNTGVVNYGVAKAGMIGLSNVVAIEGAPKGVRCNCIVPAAVTRMAEGIDTSAYPTMTAEQVAPTVGWLAHESCSITGELLVSIAGRVARAFIAETPGVYQPSWTIEQVGERIGEIRDPANPWILPVVGTAEARAGHVDHIVRSFALAQGQPTTGEH